MNILETDRLSLRQMTPDDAEFILELMNDPTYIRFIGDKGVRTIADAVEYIIKTIIDSYHRNGYGLWLVVLKESKIPIGICGLVKRDIFEDADLGYAFLADHRGMGYACEAAAAVLGYGLGVLGFARMLGLTVPENTASIHVLEKMGMKFERMVKLQPTGPDLKCYKLEAKEI